MTTVKQTIWYAGRQLHYTNTIVEPQPDEQDAMGNYIDSMQEALEMYRDRGVVACWTHEQNDVHHLYTERHHPQQLPVMELNATAFIVDFQLQEIRQHSNPYNAIPFIEMDEDTKARVRGIRAQYHCIDYIPGLDD